MYNIFQEGTSLGCCDLIAAEEFHTAMVEQGYPVSWIYIDDIFQQRKFASKINLKEYNNE